MSTETEQKKARLRAEIESLEQQRAARETELKALESETAPTIYRREHFDTLPQAQQNAVVAQVAAGEARLID